MRSRKRNRGAAVSVLEEKTAGKQSKMHTPLAISRAEKQARVTEEKAKRLGERSLVEGEVRDMKSQ